MARLLDDDRARACLEALARSLGHEGPGAEAVLASALDVVADAAVVVDADKRIVYCNERAARLTGRTLGEMLGKGCVEALHCTTCGDGCPMFDEGTVCERQANLIRADGTPIHVVKDARALRDRAGRIVGGIETLQDVTEIVRARAALAEQAARLERKRRFLEAFAESVEEGVAGTGMDGVLGSLSPRAAEMLGVPGELPPGVRLEELLDDPSGELEARVPELLEFGGRLDLEGVRARRVPGSPPLTVRITALAGADGRRLGLAVVLQVGDREDDAPFHGLVGKAPAMRHLARMIRALAASDAPVLVGGESGVGKELVARALHLAGPRAARPFVAVNCAALTEPLLESELFGHDRGAFTGAIRDKPGRLELAADGTLLLDEIGCMPLPLQAKLLRVLEGREFERVGGTRSLKFRARVVAATNADLAAKVKEGTFREDLFYRLHVVPLRVPPLRERRGDVPLLAEHFLRTLTPEGGSPRVLTAPAREALEAHGWPGNVRELRNAIQFALATGGRPAVDVHDLPPEIRPAEAADAGERARIEEALRGARYNRALAADALGMSRTTLWRKMRRYGL